MASAVLSPPEHARRSLCGGCGDVVVVARLKANGIVVVLDFAEVLPPTRCPLCRQIEARGHRRTGYCYECGGTNVIGDPLPQPGIALDADGQGRVFRGRRLRGEAIHRLHRCDVALALQAA